MMASVEALNISVAKQGETTPLETNHYTITDHLWFKCDAWMPLTDQGEGRSKGFPSA